ncbi:hypothetical protein J3A83DRAFT_4374185 [Scleroderma citrinum]
MSIDLDWHKLDSSLANTLIDILNRQLVDVKRPSFIGPVEITGFDFGTVAPDVELVDLRDIHPDFLEDDPDSGSEQDNVEVTEGAEGEDDGYEWVSRRAARHGLAEDTLAYHHLPPHVRYGRSPATDFFASTPTVYPGPQRDHWAAGPMHSSVPSLSDLRHPTPANPSRSPSSPPETHGSTPSIAHRASAMVPDTMQSLDPSSLPTQQQQEQLQQSRPDLQTDPHHLVAHQLPVSFFHVLPIKLSVTGIVFNGEVAVAFEGSRGRIHICVLDELDPYGPACRRSQSQSSTPPEIDGEMDGRRDGKPLPVGQRLLPSIFIESEIGQTDKHVLKNVTRIEKFIQDVIRKTVEEELVFPNFHTLILGDQAQ